MKMVFQIGDYWLAIPVESSFEGLGKMTEICEMYGLELLDQDGDPVNETDAVDWPRRLSRQLIDDEHEWHATE